MVLVYRMITLAFGVCTHFKRCDFCQLSDHVKGRTLANMARTHHSKVVYSFSISSVCCCVIVNNVPLISASLEALALMKIPVPAPAPDRSRYKHLRDKDNAETLKAILCFLGFFSLWTNRKTTERSMLAHQGHRVFYAFIEDVNYYITDHPSIYARLFTVFWSVCFFVVFYVQHSLIRKVGIIYRYNKKVFSHWIKSK